MNILFLSLLYHPDAIDAVARRSRDGLQNQINSYQWAFIEGLRQNMGEGETLSVLNSLPVGVFPTHYRHVLLRSSTRADHFRELGCINLPWFKQRMRAKSARREMERWIAASPENRTILLYTLYLPYMQAVEAVKRRHPDVKASVIVTDLPNELGISSGRTGLMKRIEHARGLRSIALCRPFDGFVLLTRPMGEALDIQNRPQIVIEGLVSAAPQGLEEVQPSEDVRPAVLYTGTLNRELGIHELLEAFRGMPEVQLWLCGRGDMESEIRQTAAECENIRYFGFVPQQTALAMQSKANALINPRTSQGVFTHYSFPSKTLEYMRSGKPVLCCRLEGIPKEYDAYLCYIEPQTAGGIVKAIRELLALPEAEREAIGARARQFVLSKKNSTAQCARLYQFLKSL